MVGKGSLLIKKNYNVYKTLVEGYVSKYAQYLILFSD